MVRGCDEKDGSAIPVWNANHASRRELDVSRACAPSGDLGSCWLPCKLKKIEPALMTKMAHVFLLDAEELLPWDIERVPLCAPPLFPDFATWSTTPSGWSGANLHSEVNRDGTRQS